MTDLAPDEVIDRDLLVGELEAARFADTELREDAWNPLDWVYLIGDGLFTLSAREFAPLADRLASTAGRLERLPAVLDAARETLVGHAGRPVGRFQTETALKQLAGIGELIGDALTAAEEASSTDAAVAAVQPRLIAAAETARAAVAAFETHLREVVLPASEGEGRLGRSLFVAKMRHTMRSETLTPERIMAGAEHEYTAVRGEMIRLARELWPTWCSGRPIPDDDGSLVRGVLDAIALEHPKADDLLDFCRAENARIEAFCAENDLIGLADEPLEIQWTPVFLRAFGGAMLSSPGPLDKGQKAFFAITPMPDDWSEEQRESNLREDNDRMLRLLTIHEAVPGHYLQGVYANRCPSLVRAIFASGLFAEGWAVYVTQVMMDVGYGADDPALLLDPLEVLPALDHQRDHRREDPLRRDDRGGGRRPDGRRRVPGAGRGARQVRPGAAVVDPAVDLLRGLARDVGHRTRGPPACGDRLGRPARGGSGAGTAGGRRLRRDARVQLPAAPRVGAGPRHAADVTPSADPSGVGAACRGRLGAAAFLAVACGLQRPSAPPRPSAPRRRVPRGAGPRDSRPPRPRPRDAPRHARWPPRSDRPARRSCRGGRPTTGGRASRSRSR